MTAPQFPHLATALSNEQLFLTRLWQALQSSGHLMTLDQTRAVVQIVDASFASKPVAAQSV